MDFTNLYNIFFLTYSFPHNFLFKYVDTEIQLGKKTNAFPSWVSTSFSHHSQAGIKMRAEGCQLGLLQLASWKSDQRDPAFSAVLRIITVAEIMFGIKHPTLW